MPEGEIGVMISAAREYCENYTGRAMADQHVKMLTDPEKVIRLPFAPVYEVESVQRIDSEGSGHDIEYALSEDCVVLKDTPVSEPVEIIYSATADDVPFGMIQACLQLVNHYYDNRSAVTVGGAAQAVPMTVTALLKQYKRWWA